MQESDMAGTENPIPTFPRLLARPMAVAPLMPLSLALGRLAGTVAKAHPAMFRRMGEYARSRFEIDPTDLPFTILIEPRGGEPAVSLSRRRQDCDARIAGPLAALLGLVHGAYDGDALFFSRDLVIEGDTAAVLALRNAIDAAEIDLTSELAQSAGRAGKLIRRLAAFGERRSGVALSRHEQETAAW
ncbi:MAG: SCP2 domain-containing protein [Paracoccus sp. (in: a-proteobacteria)]